MTEFVLNKSTLSLTDIFINKFQVLLLVLSLHLPLCVFFMDQLGSDFTEIQEFKPLVWFRYIGSIFFRYTQFEEKPG